MTAYYNEFDPKAASWLRELIKQGHIAPGKVDERSIIEVRPDDLVGYDQCHFFAGIGVWSHALRSAGWPDDRPVWTGSCPCQPFSAAGKRGGVKDERHLWPEFFRLIAECRPVAVFGEQVASKDGLTWLDSVHADLEGTGYTVGAVDTCAAGFGAPHIRQRLYFVGSLDFTERERDGGIAGVEGCTERKTLRGRENEGGGVVQVGDVGAVGLMGHSCLSGLEGYGGPGREQIQAGRKGEERYDAETGASCVMDDPESAGQLREVELEDGGESADRRGTADPCAASPRATNGFWSNAEWIPCRDGKARPVEPGPESLANGLAGELGLVRLVSHSDRPHQERIIYSPLIQKGKARVMRLRGYGNAIVAPQATAFIESYMEVCG